MSQHPLEDIFHPKSVAIAGASEMGDGGRYLSALLKLGFKGKIYPVHPKYQEVFGVKCYAELKDIPGDIDYVISTIPAIRVLNLIDECARKHVKCIQLFTARFSETGRKDASELEKAVLKKAQSVGIRIIGPNCMGVYYPAWGLSWNPYMTNEPGPMGLISQSGAAAYEVIACAEARGMHYSKGVSYGNALDFNECDYLEYFAQDNETKLIIMYVEGVRDGKRFLDVLRKTTPKKPVIILKGGRGKSGTRATASHTASLAGSVEVWNTAMKQAGAVNVVSIEELLDVAAAFYFLPPAYGTRTGIIGGSGGGSVMAADLCEEAGLDVIPLPNEIREELKRQGNPIWDWVGNPADFSIAMEDFDTGLMIKMMVANPNLDLNIVFMVPPGIFKQIRYQPPMTIDEYLKRFPFDDLNGKPLMVVVLDIGRSLNDLTGEVNKMLNEFRNKLSDKRIPAYPNITRAANAAVKMVNYCKQQKANHDPFKV
jgi:acyl-CoA synthetase (NDP forming)